MTIRAMADAYEIAPDPVPPELPGRVVLRISADEVIDAVLADLLVQSMMAVRQFGECHIALSPCVELAAVYRRLMYDPPLRAFPWEQTHLWVTIERGKDVQWVSDWFVEHAGMPKSHVHPATAGTDLSLLEQAMGVGTVRATEDARLDFALISAAAPLRPADGLGVYGDAGDGLALTQAVVNATRFVGVFGTGKGVRPRIVEAERAEGPLASVRPNPGQLRWYLDGDAAGETSGTQG